MCLSRDSPNRSEASRNRVWPTSSTIVGACELNCAAQAALGGGAAAVCEIRGKSLLRLHPSWLSELYVTRFNLQSKLWPQIKINEAQPLTRRSSSFCYLRQRTFANLRTVRSHECYYGSHKSAMVFDFTRFSSRCSKKRDCPVDYVTSPLLCPTCVERVRNLTLNLRCSYHRSSSVRAYFEPLCPYKSMFSRAHMEIELCPHVRETTLLGTHGEEKLQLQEPNFDSQKNVRSKWTKFSGIETKLRFVTKIIDEKQESCFR